MYKPIPFVEPEVTQNIRAEMVRVGLTNTRVAQKTGKSPSLVSKNLRGIVRTPKIREYICNATNMTEEKLWGAQAPAVEEKKRASC
jgi:hypothetical protein